MNAQRLAYHASALTADLASIVTRLDALVTQVQAAVDSPNESSQRNAQNEVLAIAKALGKSQANNLSPGLAEDLNELIVNGTPATNLVGRNLQKRIEAIADSGLTTVKTLDSFKKIQTDVRALNKAVTTLRESLTELTILPETLSPGESVLAMTMPRPEIAGLHELRKELKFLDDLVATLAECAHGHVYDPKIVTLRSTDYGIDLSADLDVVSLLALILKGLKAAFDKIRSYRTVRDEVAKLALDDDTAVKAIEAQVAKALEAARDEIEVEVMQRCTTTDDGRRNELKTKVRFRINEIANRMDRGFSFEVRTALPEAPTPEQNAKAAVVVTLNAMPFQRLEGGQLLALPEADPGEGGDGPSGEDGRPKRRAAKK